MSIPPNTWSGRVDEDEPEQSRRWHQQVHDADRILTGTEEFHSAPVLIGFECDEGVRRNQGRVGAKQGPQAIRTALANLTCPADFTLYDSGNITCTDQDMEGSQIQLADRVESILHKNGQPLVLGGGHEVAWGSFLGTHTFLSKQKESGQIGTINLDAHFDLRAPIPAPSSGSPFRQVREYCEKTHTPFHYMALGINPSANTETLFKYARKHVVKWITDTALQHEKSETIRQHLDAFIRPLDALYLSICLDVFNASFAPGVSAPAAFGITPYTAVSLIRDIKDACRYHDVTLLICDIAEMNPNYDRDRQTAGLAARLIYEIINF